MHFFHEIKFIRKGKHQLKQKIRNSNKLTTTIYNQLYIGSCKYQNYWKLMRNDLQMLSGGALFSE